MILKNLTRKKTGTRQLVRYIFRYMLQEEKTGANNRKNDTPFLIRHNIKSKSVEGFIKEFENNLLLRRNKRSDQTIIHHSILSWSHKDAIHITDTKLRSIARKFIQLRGVNNLYVGTKHTDRNHIHLHFAVSGNQISGKSSRLSQKEFSNLKKNLDAFQKEKYPELANSLPRHGRSKERANARHLHVQESEKSKEEKELTELSQLRRNNKERGLETGEERGFTVLSPSQYSSFDLLAEGCISSHEDISPG